jgi:hypothetical protein
MEPSFVGYQKSLPLYHSLFATMSSNDSSPEAYIQREHHGILSDTSYLVAAEEMEHLHLEVKLRPESGRNFPNQEFWVLEVIVVLAASLIARNGIMY